MIKYQEANKSHVSDIVKNWKKLMDYHKKLDPFFTRSDDSINAFIKHVKKSIEKDDSFLAVAINCDKVIGYCLMITSEYPPVFNIKKYGEICDMYVSEEYRNRGIGKRLVKMAIKWAKLRGLRRVELKASSKNNIGLYFWNEIGFKEYLKNMYLDGF